MGLGEPYSLPVRLEYLILLADTWMNFIHPGPKAKYSGPGEDYP